VISWVGGAGFVAVSGPAVGTFVDSMSLSVGRKAGKSVFPCAQNATQKSNSFSVIPPRISMQPSNQFSQLTLHDGMNASLRSTRMNLGCMTLNGRTNTLLTSISSPVRSSGVGNPRSNHVDGGYILPLSEDVWNNFWVIEREEKHSRTLILRFWARPLAESFWRREEICSWETDFAQKQVTIMSSWVASSHFRRVDVRIWEPVPREKNRGWEVVIRFDASEAQ